MSFPVVADSEISAFCDRANSILFKSWIDNVAQMHDREVMLHPEEHKTLYEILTKRVRPLTHGETPFAGKLDGGMENCLERRGRLSLNG